MDDKELDKKVMDIICDIITVSNSAGRESATITNRAVKRLREKMVNLIKELCKK